MDVNKYQEVATAQKLLDDAKAIYNDTKKSKADYKQAKTSLEAGIGALPLKMTVSDAWEKINQYIKTKGSTEAPTADDYQTLDIKINKKALLNTVNEAIVTSQKSQEEVVAIAVNLKNILEGKATSEQYDTVDIKLNKLNIDLVNSVVKTKGFNNLEELKSIISSLRRITIKGEGTVEDYKNIIGRDVPDGSLDIVNAKLKDENITTLTELQATFNEVQTKLKMIFDYALGDSNTTPSIQDYKFLNFNVGELTADVINPAVRNNMTNSIAKLNALFSTLPSA